jgi:5-methylcytosine-specific restriction endonuclease McrA
MRRLWDAQRGVCAWCREEIYHPDDARAAGYLNRGDSPSLEHVVPVAFGGSNRFDNLLLVHRDCNNERGTDSPTRELIEMQEMVAKATRHMPRIRAAR